MVESAEVPAEDCLDGSSVVDPLADFDPPTSLDDDRDFDLPEATSTPVSNVVPNVVTSADVQLVPGIGSGPRPVTSVIESRVDITSPGADLPSSQPPVLSQGSTAEEVFPSDFAQFFDFEYDLISDQDGSDPWDVSSVASTTSSLMRAADLTDFLLQSDAPVQLETAAVLLAEVAASSSGGRKSFL